MEIPRTAIGEHDPAAWNLLGAWEEQEKEKCDPRRPAVGLDRAWHLASHREPVDAVLHPRNGHLRALVPQGRDALRRDDRHVRPDRGHREDVPSSSVCLATSDVR